MSIQIRNSCNSSFSDVAVVFAGAVARAVAGVVVVVVEFVSLVDNLTSAKEFDPLHRFNLSSL